MGGRGRRRHWKEATGGRGRRSQPLPTLRRPPFNFEATTELPTNRGKSICLQPSKVRNHALSRAGEGAAEQCRAG
ncbi:hypothetical protein SLA2020_428630 [Shorea laevis]